MSKHSDPAIGATEADAQAEVIALQRVDETSATAFPSSIDTLHVEDEYERQADEQLHSFTAFGTETSRPTEVTAAGLELAADVGSSLVRGQTELVEDARARYTQTVRTLSPYVRRPPKAAIPHYATKAGLFIGEGLGLASAMLWLGEVEWVAAVMGISVATATLTAGLSGAEVKDLRGRALRQRDPADLNEAERAYLHLFSGPDSGWSYVKAVLYVSVSVALTLAVTIGTLRGVVDEPIVGIVFGAIGVAVAGASWLDSYAYADEVADCISRERRALHTEEKLLLHRSEHPAWRQRTEALTESASLIREAEQRGQAGATHMKALLARVLRNNPGVAGNGRASQHPAVGQTARRSGGAK